MTGTLDTPAYQTAVGGLGRFVGGRGGGWSGTSFLHRVQGGLAIIIRFCGAVDVVLQGGA